MQINRKLSLLLIAVLSVFAAHAQTVDEIVDKHIKAMGGEEKLRNMRSMYREGIIEANSMEIPMKTWIVNDKAMRMEMEVMGTNNIQVATRTSGWMMSPLQGPEPKEMDASLVRMIQPQLDLAGELYDYKTKGRKVTFEGKETTEGQDAYKLKVTYASGTEVLLFVNAGTYYIDKVQSHIKVNEREMDVAVTFSDYKKTDNGYVYPGTIMQAGATKISFTKVQVNAPVDDSLFQMPKK